MKITPGSAGYWRLFDSFQHSAYRLENLQRYQSDSEDSPLQAFLAGQPKPELPGKQAWVTRIRNARAAGKTMSRVHVVDEPLSDYLRFELTWSYPPNMAAGENIRILPRGTAEQLGLPQRDYWLFDDELLVWFCYTPAGALTAAEIEEDQAVILQARHWRDSALTAAIPCHDYTAGQPARHAS